MDQALEALVPEDHPILLELASLKSSLSRFQEEAHSAAVKLQRHSLETSRGFERAHILERENELLRNEFLVLRNISNTGAIPPSHPVNLQVQQLTLSLRELSDRLSETERILLQRTTELVSTQNELLKARVSTTAAYELASKIRAREEEEKARVTELQSKVSIAEEMANMSDKAMTEYANLVRSLEAKLNLRHESQTSANDTSTTPTIELASLKLSTEEHNKIRSLSDQFAIEKLELQNQLSTLQHESAILNANLEAERTLNAQNNLELANLRFQLQKLERDDNTAAKMVSRYMRFSQKSTDSLQSTLDTVKARHAATIDTLQEQLHSLAAQYQTSETSNDRLRQVLDELGGEMLKESYGRRREIALRIKVVNREERLLEALRRWSRRAEEALRNLDEGDASYRYLHNMVQDARILIDSLEAPLTNPHPAYPVSGSLARLINVQSAVDDLVWNLQKEQSQRLQLLVQLESTSGRKVHQGTSSPTAPLLSSQAEANPPVLGTQGYSKPSLMPVDLVSDICKFSVAKNDPSRDSILLHPSDPDAGLNISPLVLSPTPNVAEISGAIEHEDILTEAPATENGTSDSSSHEQDNATEPSDHQERSVPQSKIVDDADGISSLEEKIVDSASDVAPACTEAVVAQVASSKQTQRESGGHGSASEPADIASVVTSRTFIASLAMDRTDGQLPLELESPDNKGRTELHVIQESRPTQSSTIASSDYYIPTPENILTGSPTDLHLPISTVKAPISELSPVVVADSAVDEEQPKVALSPFGFKSYEVNSQSFTPVSHLLLEELKKVGTRYDDLQRAFYDCHLALEALKTSLSTQTYTNQGLINFVSPPSSSPQTTNSHIPPDVIKAALGRLDDFAEDARVELEVRVSDEELLAHGYETLLSIPGALASAPSLAETPHQDNQLDVVSEIKAFVSGTEPTIEKARNTFEKKLDDLQHDIAVLKRAIHVADISSLHASPTTAPNGNGWTSWIRTPSRSASPLPGLGAAPTFGNVMTNPKLRRYPSAFNLSRKSSFHGVGSNTNAENPLSTLGLRIPMPRFEPLLKPTSPLQTGEPSLPSAAAPRSRTISTMFMIGLGMRSSGTAFSPTAPSPQRRVVSAVPIPIHRETDEKLTSTETDDHNEEESDIE